MGWAERIEQRAKRRKKEKPEPFIQRVSPELLRKIDAQAAKLDLSRNEFVNMCLEEALRDLEKKEVK
jgi:predicted HicB family RNase H-like nuclease